MKLIRLALAALLLLVSPCLYAAKPLKSQEISTGTLRDGNALTCDVSNLTDDVISVDITIYYRDAGLTLYEAPVTLSVNPKSIGRHSIGVHKGGYCSITWEGQVGELRGTACSFFRLTSPDPEVYEFRGCSDAY